jgi:23S rRNA (cytidine1920-2'-O)/16S rRNA (cytidine1409-2'-O)-methyltransferase
VSRKFRADELLVHRGLCESRNLAKTLIMAGKVRLPDSIVTKPSQMLPVDAPITIIEAQRYVGRGGEKLEKFLQQFNIDAKDKRCLDIGASTGGFTDCLLQHGATHVTCVDVGHGQLHYKLRQDPRVTNLEKTNARYLKPQDLPHPTYDFIVMDVSFISITKILPTLWPLLNPSGTLITLIKPQFEAEKKEVDQGAGIISDPAIHQRILTQILEFCKTQLPHCHLLGPIESPIRGGDGNLEFLLGLH